MLVSRGIVATEIGRKSAVVPQLNVLESANLPDCLPHFTPLTRRQVTYDSSYETIAKFELALRHYTFPHCPNGNRWGMGKLRALSVNTFGKPGQVWRWRQALPSRRSLRHQVLGPANLYQRREVQPRGVILTEKPETDSPGLSANGNGHGLGGCPWLPPGQPGGPCVL